MSIIEDKSDKKYQDYRKRFKEIEEENEQINLQLVKARHHIKRLRVERIVLLEEIDNLKQGRNNKKGFNTNAESDSEMSMSESVVSNVKRKNTTTPPKKPKDPNAPKGPGNVFFLYCKLERDNIKDEIPSESSGEITRILGQKWKSLSKEEKQKYYDIYKKEVVEHETAMKSYNAAGGGIEGAAAVEANKKHELSDEEIDMLNEDDKEVDEEGEDSDNNQTPNHTFVSPPSSNSTIGTPQN